MSLSFKTEWNRTEWNEHCDDANAGCEKCLVLRGRGKHCRQIADEVSKSGADSDVDDASLRTGPNPQVRDERDGGYAQSRTDEECGDCGGGLV